MSRKIPTAALAAAVLVAAFATGCQSSGSKAPAYDSVLLITMDTLREDYLSCYGPSPVQTPHFDRLAAEGVIVRRAWSPVPLTTPAHATIMTGLYPPGNGVRNNAHFRLPDNITTLAEIMRDSGRRTGAVISSFTTSRLYGLGQGFEFFDDDLGHDERGRPRQSRRGDEVLARAVRWLDQNSARPFFLWVHFFDPHTPYESPESFSARFPGNPYAAEVAFTDFLLGALLEKLEKSPAGRRTLVVLVADHGEGLGTHGEAEHGLLLYEEVLAVPFLMRAPGLIEAGSSIPGPASLADVVPTICSLMKLPVPPGIQGVDITAPPQAGRKIYAETLYPYEEFGWSPLYALRKEDLKYIEAPAPELYDLPADPREGTNLAAARPREARDLSASLKSLSQGLVNPENIAAATGGAGKADTGTVAQLESLGYIAGGGGAAPGAHEPLPAVAGRNPREGTEDYRVLVRAMQLAGAGDPGSAVELLQKLVARDPGNPQFLLKLAAFLGDQGREAEADRRYKELLASHPTFTMGYRFYNGFLEARGRNQEALDMWKRLAVALPGFAGLETHLARAEIRAGAPGEAVRRLETYLARHPEDAAAWSQLGDGHLALKRGNEALEAFRRALALQPTEQQAVSGAVGILKASGRGDEARELLRELLKQAPGDPILASALAGL